MDDALTLAIPLPAMHGLVEVWALLSESDKTAVSDFFSRWTELWTKWRGFMAPGQEQNFVAHMNTELVEQVSVFKARYATRLVRAPDPGPGGRVMRLRAAGSSPRTRT